MAKTVEYRDTPLQSAPHHPVDGKKWQLRIFISVDDHRGVRTREFLADVFYATEQEADTHGIAFGQRLIDGKVEGRSVMDMKTADRRATPRLRCNSTPRFQLPRHWKERASCWIYRIGGCRIESPVTMEPGVSLELRIYASNVEWPLMVEAASVQWVSGQTFGLAFFRITEPEQQRLGQVINDLMEGEATAG